MSKKIAIIVGGTGEIGKCIVDVLHKEGYYTICVSNENSSIIEKNSYTEYFNFDMTHLGSIEECSKKISQKYKKIDVLINVIGKNRPGSLSEITEEMWNDVINTNLKSVFFICKMFYDLLRKSNEGVIINFASTAGIRALPKSPHYIAAKAGVIALTKYFAQVYAPHIRVNCIAPGFVLTTNHYPENYTKYTDVIERIPLYKMTSIDEIAETVIFLIKTKTITGHTLVIDGGLII